MGVILKMGIRNFIVNAFTDYCLKVLDVTYNLNLNKSQKIEKVVERFDSEDLVKLFSYLMKRFDLVVKIIRSSNGDELEVFNSNRDLICDKNLLILMDKKSKEIYDIKNRYFGISFIEWVSRTHLEFRNGKDNLEYASFYDNSYLDYV